MPDPIRKRFGDGQLWPLRPACSQNRAASCMPGSTSRIRFRSVFPKKAWIILYCDKTDPDPIWMALSGFGEMHLVWKQVGVQEPSGLVFGRTQPARYQLFHFQTRLQSSTVVPDHIVKNQLGSCLVLADCVRF